MNRWLVIAAAIAVAQLLSGDCASGQESQASVLRLRLTPPPAPVIAGQRVAVTCTITNAEPIRADVCVLAGEEWSFHSEHRGSDVNSLKIVDHTYCVAEFSLDPGAARSWESAIGVPDEVTTGTLTLKLTVLRGPRDSRGLYPPERGTLESAPIPIEIAEEASKTIR
jgi:hypothetical protein